MSQIFAEIDTFDAAQPRIAAGSRQRTVVKSLHHPAGLAVLALRELFLVVGDAVLVVVILDSGFDGLFGEHRAVELVRGQAAGRAVVCVTHDAADAGLLAARTVQLCAKNGAKASRPT